LLRLSYKFIIIYCMSALSVSTHVCECTF